MVSMTNPFQNLRSPTLLRIAGVPCDVLAYVGLLLSAAADSAGIYLVLLVTAVLIDLALEGSEPWLLNLLRTAQLSLSLRGVLLSLSFGLLMIRHFPDWGDGQVLAAVLLVVALPMSRSLYLGVLGLFRIRSTRPLVTRNLDLGDLADPPPPPTWLTTRVNGKIVLLGAIPVAVGGVGIVADTVVPFVVAGLGYVLVFVAGSVFLGARLVRSLRAPNHTDWEAEVLHRVRELRPEIVLYFSGPADSTYQINMWLETLEQLPYRTLVLLRERHMLEGLAPTTLPVACIPDGVAVMRAGLFSARVALYPANTLKNMHLLREPGIKHVFIGHGDSDKVSSINPFTRVYDEVWVAGQAGRDRWARARVGVRDEAIVEVGRPQLDSVHPVGSAPLPERLTVLYAPTWEGWNDDKFFSSITRMGPLLVRALLDMHPAVRVIYKPHPFTGMRDPRAARSHEQIAAMLSEANREPTGASDDPQLAALIAEMGVAKLSVAESRRLDAAWSSRYWTTLPDSRHVVVDGQRPTLYDCFDYADVLISDVSSVVSDFLASGKPYVCANPQGISEEEFRQENPTAGAAYLLGPDCTELAGIIDLVRGADPMAPQRTALREYLLGPESPSSLERWKDALDALMLETDDDRAAREFGIDESVLAESSLHASVLDGSARTESDLTDADDPEHASSESPTV
jgi:hypothetical protein